MSADAPYGVGVVGSGFMGRTWAQVVSRHVDRARLVGVTTGRRAPALAADYGCELFASLDEMLERDDINVVVLATPPHVHADEAVRASAAGKHLLIEKPMANTPAECRAMLAAAEQHGVELAVVSQHRFRHTPRHVRSLIDAGAVGEIRMVRAIGPETGFWDTSVTQDEWKLDPALQTVYASWAAHACDLLRWFVGVDATTSYALMTAFGGGPPPRRSAMVTYGFANAAMAQVWMSYDIPQPGLGSGLQFEIVGSEAIVRLDSYGAVELGAGDGWTTVARQEQFDPLDPLDARRLEAYVAEFDDLLDAVIEGRRPAVDGRSGLRTVAMIAAAEQSATSGAQADVEPVDVPGDLYPEPRR